MTFLAFAALLGPREHERRSQAMYQLDETEMRREHRRELPEGSAKAPRLAARRTESVARPRVVRVPGGFAFVADKAAEERS
jgi:hypothetical protein